MIIFKYVRWKNFLSTGNNFTEIQLDRNPTTLIIGENGAGKSTILDALCFGLFGKPFRNISKGQLLNTVNGSSAMVELEFRIGTKEIKVRRGIKPNVFEIYINGKMYNQDANARDYQKYLEQQILKLQILMEEMQKLQKLKKKRTLDYLNLLKIKLINQIGLN